MRIIETQYQNKLNSEVTLNPCITKIESKIFLMKYILSHYDHNITKFQLHLIKLRFS